MNKAYSALSKVYETLMDGDDYRRWADRLITLLNENVSSGAFGYDLACGSGYFTRAIKRAGYDVVGVDISEEMLTEAKKLCAKENLNVEFLRQDMTCLKSFKKADFLTCINDGVNYLSPERLKKAFKTFFSRLGDGGALLFDFSTEYKLRGVIGDNMFGEDYDDLSYLWFNKLYDDRVEMELSVFTRVGELFEKREESHVQYIHTLSFMEKSLKEAGFISVKSCAFGGGEILSDTQRIEIIATKKR